MINAKDDEIEGLSNREVKQQNYKIFFMRRVTTLQF